VQQPLRHAKRELSPVGLQQDRHRVEVQGVLLVADELMPHCQARDKPDVHW
jgi:hypothetical protein